MTTHDITKSACPGCGAFGLLRRETGWAYSIDTKQAQEHNAKVRNHTCRPLDLMTALADMELDRDVHAAIAATNADERDAALAILRDIQWRCRTSRGPWECPSCAATSDRPGGHRKSCQLARAIAAPCA